MPGKPPASGRIRRSARRRLRIWSRRQPRRRCPAPLDLDRTSPTPLPGSRRYWAMDADAANRFSKAEQPGRLSPRFSTKTCAPHHFAGRRSETERRIPRPATRRYARAGRVIWPNFTWSQNRRRSAELIDAFCCQGPFRSLPMNRTAVRVACQPFDATRAASAGRDGTQSKATSRCVVEPI